MENPTFAQTIKSHLENGQIGEAIAVFKVGLEANSRAPALRMLRVIESNYQLARQNEQKGILSFAEARQEYARAADAVLGLLESVENQVPGRVSPKNKMRRGLWIGVGLAGLVFLAVLFFYPKFKVGCPYFDEKKALKVMILPFGSLGGGSVSTERPRPEILVKDQIEELVAKAGLSVSAAIQSNFDPESELPDHAKARRLAEHCGADLIIWGKFVQKSDSIRLKLEYVSVKNGREGQSVFRSLPDLSFWDGAMDKELSDAVFAVCARVAGLLDKKEVTVRWLGKLKEPDATEAQALKKLTAKD